MRRLPLSVGIVAFSVALLDLPSIAQTDSFDTPRKRKVVDLGPSEYSPGRVRNALSCWYFPKFIVKQLDMGQKGAERLSILPVANGTTPTCTLAHEDKERVIEAREWSGYFKGVKGQFVFFDADDGIDGGLPFAIYDSRTGGKLFQDSVFRDVYFSHTQDGHLSLKYLRVVAGDCSLPRDKTACWQQIRKNLNLKTELLPTCTGYTSDITETWSTVAYPVEVTFFPEPSIVPQNGKVMCWPVD